MAQGGKRTGWVRPKRSLGQNFLIDANVARRIVSRLHVQPGEQVVEIGPGQGALTAILDQAGVHLLAVEKDQDLAVDLKARMPGVQVMVADALNLDWSRLWPGRSWKMIGNLPYNVASPLIWNIASTATVVTHMVFTVQREVGQRLVAQPGGKIYGALSVWVQSFFRPQLEFVLRPSVFRPQPKVDSAVVSMRALSHPPNPEDQKALSRVLRICFQHRRKQLKTLLRPYWQTGVQAWFAQQGIDPSARPETLTPNQFLSLARRLIALGTLDN